MAENNCAACSMKARYDSKPTSLLGRLWRWHINWCPGWKKYMASLSDEERHALAERYHLKHHH